MRLVQTYIYDGTEQHESQSKNVGKSLSEAFTDFSSLSSISGTCWSGKSFLHMSRDSNCHSR